MLTITRRAARLGSSVNVRTEKHGDDDVPAIDVTVSGIMLEPEELNALLEDPKAYDALFRRDDQDFPQPTFPQLKPFSLESKFEGVLVQLHVGPKPSIIELTDTKLNRVTLTPQPGGQTALSVQVQATPSEKVIGQVSTYMNHEVSVELSGGEKAKPKDANQANLPLQMGGDTPPPAPANGKKRGRAAPAAH